MPADPLKRPCHPRALRPALLLGGPAPTPEQRPAGALRRPDGRLPLRDLPEHGGDRRRVPDRRPRPEAARLLPGAQPGRGLQALQARGPPGDGAGGGEGLPAVSEGHTASGVTSCYGCTHLRYRGPQSITNVRDMMGGTAIPLREQDGSLGRGATSARSSARRSRGPTRGRRRSSGGARKLGRGQEENPGGVSAAPDVRPGSVFRTSG